VVRRRSSPVEEATYLGEELRRLDSVNEVPGFERDQSANAHAPTSSTNANRVRAPE
jgi:hypothetical protein